MSVRLVPGGKAAEREALAAGLARTLAQRHRGESQAVLTALAAAALNAQRSGRNLPEPAAAPSADDPVHALCRRIVARLQANAIADPTGGATRWHRRWNYPRWARGRAPVFEAGDFLFYPQREEQKP
ncbi:MAG: hypothetical protein R3316_02985 [Rhodovibrionaceae bacterium]|nr:hypothetical protein [Rhodovibrionaceae bacterium]